MTSNVLLRLSEEWCCQLKNGPVLSDNSRDVVSMRCLDSLSANSSQLTAHDPDVWTYQHYKQLTSLSLFSTQVLSKCIKALELRVTKTQIPACRHVPLKQWNTSDRDFFTSRKKFLPLRIKYSNYYQGFLSVTVNHAFYSLNIYLHIYVCLLSHFTTHITVTVPLQYSLFSPTILSVSYPVSP